MKKTGPWICFSLSLFFFALAASSPLLIPLVEAGREEAPWMNYLVGGLFWGGLLLGVIATVLLTLWRRKQQKRGEEAGKLPSFFRFFSNSIATAADIVFFVSAVSLILLSFLQGIAPVWVYISMALTLFSLECHGLFNGKNFSCLTTWKRSELA